MIYNNNRVNDSFIIKLIFIYYKININYHIIHFLFFNITGF
jgi:hypothetical protein